MIVYGWLDGVIATHCVLSPHFTIKTEPQRYLHLSSLVRLLSFILLVHTFLVVHTLHHKPDGNMMTLPLTH